MWPVPKGVIDGEVFQHFRSKLPVTSEDLIETFGLKPGMDVLVALEMARYLNSTGIVKKEHRCEVSIQRQFIV